MDRYNRYSVRSCPCTDNKKVARMSEQSEYCLCDSQPVSLAMAYVPKQEFKNLVGVCEGLDKGTIFEDLYMPYCMGGCR